MSGIGVGGIPYLVSMGGVDPDASCVIVTRGHPHEDNDRRL